MENNELNANAPNISAQNAATTTINTQNPVPVSNTSVTNTITSSTTDSIGVPVAPDVAENTSNMANGALDLNTNGGKPKKNNGVVIALVIILIALLAGIGYYVYSSLNGNKSKGDNNANEVINDNNNVIDTPTSNLTTDYVPIENEIYTKNKSQEYVNYTTYDGIYSSYEGKMVILNVIDGNLVATLEDNTLKVNGIEGKVKTFVAGGSCGGIYSVLVMTEDNLLFYASAIPSNNRNRVDENFEFEFQKLSIENVANITKYVYAGYRTCSEPDYAIVLTTGEIMPAKRIYDSEIGTFDYRIVKNELYPIVIYEDNTISKILDDGYNGPAGEKLKYNDKELIIQRFYEMTAVSDTPTIVSYMISDNKLYKLTANISRMLITSIDIELINETEIANETFNRSEKTDVIEFADGQTFEMTNVEEIYG